MIDDWEEQGSWERSGSVLYRWKKLPWEGPNPCNIHGYIKFSRPSGKWYGQLYWAGGAALGAANDVMSAYTNPCHSSAQDAHDDLQEKAKAEGIFIPDCPFLFSPIERLARACKESV